MVMRWCCRCRVGWSTTLGRRGCMRCGWCSRSANADFEVESKFESMGSAQYQDEGILVEQDASTALRFDVFNAGGGQVILFAASVSGATASVKVATTLASAPAPFWLRVKRTGSTWLFTYSLDGVTWLTGGSFSFAMTVAKVGPYAGNAGSPPPAWTATVDYFFNTASPIVPEDGGSGTTTTLTNDDFSAGSLNANTWSFVNPSGGSQSMDGQHAVINVPAGSSHDPASSGNARAADRADDPEQQPEPRRQVRLVGVAAIPGARCRRRAGLDALPLRRAWCRTSSRPPSS